MTTAILSPPSATERGLVIEELTGMDLKNGFLETLASLAETGLTHQSAAQIFQERQRAGHRTYVTKINNRVVATATLLLDRKFIHSGGLVGHLEDVAVHRDWQGRGLGASLVRHVTAMAREAGCYKVILNCHDRLVPFYQRLRYHPQDVGMRIDEATIAFDACDAPGI